MKFEFTDKATYLAWRQEWRNEYAALSNQIRNLRRGRKQFLDTYRRYTSPQGPARERISHEPNPLWGKVSGLYDLSFQARYQMERLAEAKALSWVLRNARLAEAA